MLYTTAPRARKHFTRRVGGLMAMMILAAPVSGAQQPNGSRNGSGIEPRAVDALRQMGAYLRTLKRFGVQGDAVRDEVSSDGQKIQLTGSISYLVRPPTGLRVDLRTDRKQRQIFYDGRTLTVYAPRMKHYASTAAPPTIRAMLDEATSKLGIEFPLADLFTWGTDRDGVKDLTAARYVGPAYINGADTDHYAFRQDDADWQLWIERGAKPLPRKIVITTTDEPSQPQYAVTLKWDLDARFNDAVFAFVPPSDATRIPFESAVALSPAAPRR